MKDALPPVDWRQDLGPLRVFFLDPQVSEIMVNSFDSIFAEKNGVIVETKAKFASAEALNRLIQSMVVAAGKELNRKNPFVDARLPDGSRMNCVVPPASLDGPILTIRKFMAQTMTLDTLIQNQMLDKKAAYFLRQVVPAKFNVLVSGGTGSGKTTLLNVLSGLIPADERIITLEDTPELRIGQKNVVRMECRPTRGPETGISMRELLSNALRMRPNRIIVGECRGGEAYDMLQAMNTGHSGCMTTVHANSAGDALRRLEGMILRTESTVGNSQILRRDIFETIDIIVHCERCDDGRRRIIEIAETVTGDGGETYTQTLFRLNGTNGLVVTDAQPLFFNKPRLVKRLEFPDGFFGADLKLVG